MTTSRTGQTPPTGWVIWGFCHHDEPGHCTPVDLVCDVSVRAETDIYVTPGTAPHRNTRFATNRTR